MKFLPGATIFIKHSIANGIYGEIAWAHPVIEKDIQAVYGRMLELVKEDLPFELLHLSVTELREKYGAPKASKTSSDCWSTMRTATYCPFTAAVTTMTGSQRCWCRALGC